jgi:uncharacterized coiled-coil DUF342 family protein
MSTVTLERIDARITELQKDIEEVKEYMREDFQLADDVRGEIEESRRRPDSKFVKHDDVMKRYS